MTPVRFFLLIIFLLALLPGCRSETEKKSQPRTYREEIREGSPEDQPKEYKRPDGGFGVLDDSREVKDAVETQEKESEQALQDTQ